jgi:hypothetical protein
MSLFVEKPVRAKHPFALSFNHASSWARERRGTQLAPHDREVSARNPR